MTAAKLPENEGGDSPQLHVDQLTVIAIHHNAKRHHLPPVSTIERDNNEITHEMILQGTSQGQINPRLIEKYQQQRDD